MIYPSNTRDTQFDLRVIVPGESLKVLLNDINQEEQEDNHTIIIVLSQIATKVVFIVH